MRLFYSIVVLFTLLLQNLSCSRGDDQVDYFITADKTILLVESVGAQDTVLINSNINWTITGIPDWIKMNMTSGTPGQSKLIVSIDRNQGVQPLTAEVTINGEGVEPVTIKITQSGSLPILSVNKTSFEVSASGQIDSMVITSNVDWTISVPGSASWIIIDKSHGSAGVTTVHIEVAPNSGREARTAILGINSAVAGTMPTEISVVQQYYNLASFSPQKGPWKTVVTINGVFGDNPIVKINDVTCTVINSSPSQVQVSTPKEATSGKISISFGDHKVISEEEFFVTNTWIKVLDGGYSGLGGVIQQGVSFAWNNRLYYGFGLDMVSSTINTFGFRVYDPSNNKWSQGPSQPAEMGGRTAAGCLFANGKLFIGLGAYYTFYQDYWTFDPSGELWTKLAYFPSKGIHPLSFENNNSVYIGHPENEPGVMHRYNPSGGGAVDTWPIIPCEFPELSASLSFTIGDITYIAGGMSKTGGALASTYRFDPANNSITRVADNFRYTTFQGEAVSFVLNDKGYIVESGNIHQYDPIADIWTTFNPTIPPHGMDNRGSLVNGEIYAWDEDGTVYKYIPL